MKQAKTHTIWEGISESFTHFLATFISLIKSSKAFIFVASTAAWLTSTYVNVLSALAFFAIATTLDTWSRIDVNAKKKRLKFNPLRRKFWFEISSDALRIWFKKVFQEYFVYVIIAFALDILILKSCFKFNVLYLKLDIPTATIILFAFNEVWSIFENREELGKKNYLKKIIGSITPFFPESWQTAIKEIQKKSSKTKQDAN